MIYLAHLAYLARSIAEYGMELLGRDPQDLLREVILQVESDAVENREGLLRMWETDLDSWQRPASQQPKPAHRTRPVADRPHDRSCGRGHPLADGRNPVLTRKCRGGLGDDDHVPRAGGCTAEPADPNPRRRDGEAVT